MKDCILGNDFKPQRVTESFTHWVNVDLFASQKIAQAVEYMVVREEREKKVSEKAASITHPSSKPTGLPLLDVPSPWIRGLEGRKRGSSDFICFSKLQKPCRALPGGLESCVKRWGPSFDRWVSSHPVALGSQCTVWNEQTPEMCAHRGVSIGQNVKLHYVPSLRCSSEWPLEEEWELLANVVNQAHSLRIKTVS